MSCSAEPWNPILTLHSAALGMTKHINCSLALVTVVQCLHEPDLTLCSAIFQLVFASIALVGRQFTVLLAIKLFALGSVICAVSHKVATLPGGRYIQGMGAGRIVVLTYFLVGDLYTLEQSSKMISLIGLEYVRYSLIFTLSI
jgi:MFS family permease